MISVSRIVEVTISASIYKGKVLLVVNVASKCGYTNTNYTELPELYTQFKDKGFEILAFPCNPFLKQSNLHAQARYNAEYPIFHKADIRKALGET